MNDPQVSSTSDTVPSPKTPAAANNYDIQEEQISAGKGVRIYDRPQRSGLLMTIVGLALLVILVMVAIMVFQFIL